MDTFEGYADDPPSLHKYTFNQNDPVNRFDPDGHESLAESMTVASLAPMVRKMALDLFQGANNFSYGLGGGDALKFTSRAEAYMIDSLAAGPGWKMGQPNFWAAVRGAPFLLQQNPNLTQTRKPCWYECIPFDEDAPVYGPAARFPMFEMEPSELMQEFVDFGHGSLAGATLRTISEYFDRERLASSGFWSSYLNDIAKRVSGSGADLISPQSNADGYRSLGLRAYTVMLREMEQGSGGVWVGAQGLSSVVGDIVGYNKAYEAGFGFDRQNLRLLGGLERLTLGFEALSQMAGTAAGLVGGFNPELQSLRLNRPLRIAEAAEAVAPGTAEAVCKKPSPSEMAIGERVQAALDEARTARMLDRVEGAGFRPGELMPNGEIAGMGPGAAYEGEFTGAANAATVSEEELSGLRITRGDGLYVLRDQDNIIRYVGSGNVEARLLAHSQTAGKWTLTPQVIWETGSLSRAEALALEGRLMGRLGGPLKANPNTMLLNVKRAFSKKSSLFTEIRKALSGTEGKELWAETMRRLRAGD